MSASTDIFQNGSKVVISPDKMRAWVSLAPPPKGAVYTAEAVAAWLPENGVVFGADEGMIKKAVASKTWDDLLEVARGRQPVAPSGGDYTLKVEKKPFTGLRGGADGSLVYDDLSFLQEVQPGQLLADITPGTPAQMGMTVTGEALQPRGGSEGRSLSGSGFALSADGRSATAPGLAHVSVVNEQLVVTPLLKLPAVEAGEAVEFEGNLLVEGDVKPGAALKAGGSLFVAGRTASATIEAGNNVLLCGGLRAEGAGAAVQAKGSVWGLFFEGCDITAGGDICANHLFDCEAKAEGRANILGGRAAVRGGSLTASGGVVTGRLGGEQGDKTRITAGLAADVVDRYEAMVKRIGALEIELTALQQNLAAHERVHRGRPDRGRGDAAYKEMASKLKQQSGVLNILTRERTRLKRVVEGSTAISVIAREAAFPGVTVNINNRSYLVGKPMGKVKFHYARDRIEANELGERDR